MRSTIERRPFERCGVRCSARPSVAEGLLRRRSSTISAAGRSERSATRSAIETAHDMGVAVAAQAQDGLAVAPLDAGLEPDLACAAHDLVLRRCGPRRGAAASSARARSDSGSAPPNRRGARNSTGSRRPAAAWPEYRTLARPGRGFAGAVLLGRLARCDGGRRPRRRLRSTVSASFASSRQDRRALASPG